jgi:hypothetical protein
VHHIPTILHLPGAAFCGTRDVRVFKHAQIEMRNVEHFVAENSLP